MAQSVTKPAFFWKPIPGAEHGHRYTYVTLYVEAGTVHWERTERSTGATLTGQCSQREWDRMYLPRGQFYPKGSATVEDE